MRIAFVDARQKTKLFRAVAERLDHEIHWLIQDHSFALHGVANQTVIPYPSARDLRDAVRGDAEAQGILDRVRLSDRVSVTFGRTLDHYNWYYERIVEWFDSTNPDIIFGEAGSFHSHITALVAERRGIRFLNPLSSRYPAGRFAFFEGDRLIPFGGSGEVLSDAEYDVVIEGIRGGTRPPDYMTVRASRLALLASRTRGMREWLRGERFTAQSPAFFLRARQERAQSQARWEQSASLEPLKRAEGLRVLYPLQLQPEMNLDVWGYEFREQANVVRGLASRLANEAQLWIKPNPKSGFELDDAMIDLVKELPNVFAVPAATRMSEIVDDFDLVCTVSGSVAIERLIGRKPVAVFLRDYADWLGAPWAEGFSTSDSDLDAEVVQRLAAQQVRVEPRDVMRRLIATSYPGVISEPDIMPGVLEESNLSRVATAFEHVMSQSGAAPGPRLEVRP